MNSSAKSETAPTWRADAALAALALMWGSTFVITKDVVSTHSPLFYTSTRFGIASAVFGLMFARHLRSSRLNEIREGVILGSCVFAGILLQVSGIVYTTASKAGFITGLYLVFTPVISYLVFRVRPSRDNMAGLLLAIGGFAVLSAPRSGAGEGSLLGDMLVLCAASAWATHIVATSVYGRRSDIRTLAAVQVFTVAALAITAYLALHAVALSASNPQQLPRLLALEARDNPLTWRFLAQVGYMALFATILAALVQTWAQGKLSPTHSAILYALEPASGAFFAYLVFGERLGARGGVGAALIIAGVFVSRLGLWSRLLPARAARQWNKTEITEQTE
jgi:drug/metabolite transporter (DMT)-like permease